jgi:IclR family pca regulon transcriptional regulator
MHATRGYGAEFYSGAGSRTLLRGHTARAFGQRRQTLTQSQVAKATGLSRATARRFLQSMGTLGCVGRTGREYYLRPRVPDLGYAYLSSMTLWDVAKSQMEMLVQQVQESSSAAVLDGTDIIFTVRADTAQRDIRAGVAGDPQGSRPARLVPAR